MAVLRNPIAVRGTPNECIRYIQNSQKAVASSQTMNVMAYMQSHCIEDIESVGYNGCSGIRSVANEQFLMAQALYRKSHKEYQEQTVIRSVAQHLEAFDLKWLPDKIKTIPPEDADSMMPLQTALEVWNNKESSVEQMAEAYRVMSAYKIVSKKSEIDAHHFVLSFHPEDNPSAAKVQSVVDQFMAHPYFEGFPALSNIHFDRPHKHAHVLCSNYHSSGTRKLSIKGAKVAELKRHLDRICYEHGLSIIDSREMRKDPEYSKWLDGVIAEGKVKVRKPVEFEEEEDKLRRKQAQAKRISRKKKGNQNYKAHHASQVAERSATLDATPNIHPAVREDLKDFARNDLFVGDGQYIKATMQSRLPHELRQLPEIERRKRTAEAEAAARRKRAQEEEQWRRVYCVRVYIYDRSYHRYRQRSLIELLFELAKVILTNESQFFEKNYPVQYDNFVLNSPTNWKIQNMIDSISTTQRLNVRTPAELDRRVEEIGAAIGEKQKAVNYDKRTMERGRLLYNAIMTWRDESQPEEARKAAYAILARNKCTTDDKMDKFVGKYEAACHRIPRNEEQLQELRKEYRAAKKAQGSLLAANAQCQDYSVAIRQAMEMTPEDAAKRKRDLTTIIAGADKKTAAPQITAPRNTVAEEAEKAAQALEEKLPVEVFHEALPVEEQQQYIVWVRGLRAQNNRQAEITTAQAERVLSDTLRSRGQRYDRNEFQDLNYLIQQTAQLEASLRTEGSKLDRILERWEKSTDPSLPDAEWKQHRSYIEWCGLDPDNSLDLSNLQAERELVDLQLQQAIAMREALLHTADQWRGHNNLDRAENNLAWTKQREQELKQQLHDIRESRHKLWEIASNCEKAARRRIFAGPQWQKVTHYRSLWYDKVRQQQEIEKKLEEIKRKKKDAKREVREARKEARRLEKGDTEHGNTDAPNGGTR